VARAEQQPEIDLLLAAPTPSIQVFDIERELARLEEVLRSAIPPERRPAKTGTWSFGKDLTGESLGGKYRIKTLKGKGAFKTVYEGEDEMLGARVAVAVLNPKGARSPRALEHFQDEAKKLTTLDHENIVRWITFDRTQDGLHYFVMEYLDGEELEETLRREGRLAPKRVARILLQVVAALKRAHKTGKQGSLLHLDLKPENVFVLPPLAPGEPERVKVIDFGIGQHVGAEIRAAERPELRSLYDLPAEDLGKSIGSLALPEDEEEGQAPEDSKEAGSREAETKAGALVPAVPVKRKVQRARGGTLLYASPEQCKHLAGHKDIENLDGRSDLYSLGVMAFRMLTGQYPFVRIATAFEAIENHLKAPPRKVGSLGIKVPRDLAAFVDRCLVKDREKRWKNADEAYAALEHIVHPRMSAVKVVVPIAGIAAAGLGSLFFLREPAVNPLNLIDPAIQNLAARVVSEVHLGPKKPSRTLELVSEVSWDATDPPAPVLRDDDSGEDLAGWSARWTGVGGAIEIACLDGAASARARIELDGGRHERWQSDPVVLNHLGSWKIESVAGGSSPTKELDPHGRFLVIEVGGDPQGREELAAIEVFEGGKSIGQTSVASGNARGASVLYTGPSLEPLFSGGAHEVVLRVVARDRAGQEEEARATFDIAGEPPAFRNEGTGFVAKAEPGAALLEYGSVQVVYPDYGLRIETTARAQARVFLEPADEPVVTREVAGPHEPLVIALKDLGIAGTSDRSGSLRIEIDDLPWVDRATPRKESKPLAFHFTPRPPELQAFLSGDGWRRDLVEQRGSEFTNPVNAGLHVKLAVSPTAGSQLWIEAACASEPDGSSEPARMTRTGSEPFELPLDLPDEGSYRIVVRKFVLGTGEQKGPPLPPEHVFRIVVDRKEPVVELELEGAQGADADGVKLFKGAFSQRIVANVTESVGLDELAWTLTQPGGQKKGDKLRTGTQVELPPLEAFESVDGRYELEVVARDKAGNVGSNRVAWQVARGGPELELLVPSISSTDRRWILGGDQRWNVRVQAVDPNGVAGVRARIVYQDKPGAELELVRASDERWELRESDLQTAFFWWTGKPLAIELTARDGAGLEASKTVSGIVPELGKTSDYVIGPRDRPKESMVEIEVAGSYVFGGRKGEDAKKWNVELKNLRSFYLDTREVTRGEFLEFVREADGYANAAWWPAGARPDAKRKAQLESALSGDPTRTATGITWPEAAAYAASRGKRLPTLVEWEYAVRGPGYAPQPPWEHQQGAADGWPANLCAGAREWTATPEDLVAEGYDFPSQCKRYPERLCPPPVSGSPAPASASLGAPVLATSHWIVGPRAGGSADWTAAEACADAPGADDLGFRCALDVETAHSRLDEGQYRIVE
jgi:serine/threonine protein kinase